VEPVSVNVQTFGTGEADDNDIAEAVREVFDFRPKAIIENLGLRNPIYTPTAAYGHFGRTPETRVPDAGGDEPVTFFPWETTELVGDLRSALAG